MAADTLCYLDYNATAPLRPTARAAMIAAWDVAGNASSPHSAGRAARRIVEAARAQVAAAVGAPPAAVIFTAGGTEADNLAVTGTGHMVVMSAIEHDAVRLAAGDRAVTIPVDADGRIALTALERILSAMSGSALVSVMLVNNETGTIQPVAEAAAIARRYGALIHTDAVQALGRVAIDLRRLDVDMISLSAHKLGGPKGVGALIVRDGVPLRPLLRGGGQERRRRAGTENVAGIAGFGAVCAEVEQSLADQVRLAGLRDRLEATIRSADPALVVFGATAPRVGNTSCLAMTGVAADTQLMAFDLAGIAVSSGAACSSGKVATSHVLRAMAAAPDLAGSAVRVSLGWGSGPDDVARFTAAWLGLRQRTRPDRVA
ncbi:MAG: cysteine desulfurase family protein [Azospirillaceae bacterium]|nr:cysteine desulfurase family protein [Azospirillaceae bacterium]